MKIENLSKVAAIYAEVKRWEEILAAIPHLTSEYATLTVTRKEWATGNLSAAAVQKTASIPANEAKAFAVVTVERLKSQLRNLGVVFPEDAPN